MTDPGSSRARGRAVEVLVGEHLERHGLQILARNVELAAAELDLVALDPRGAEEIIVFVEVRSRSTTECGTPIETIGRAKQTRLIRAATAWLVQRGLWERVPVRFDVVGVVTDGASVRDLEWIEDAFSSGSTSPGTERKKKERPRGPLPFSRSFRRRRSVASTTASRGLHEAVVVFAGNGDAAPLLGSCSARIRDFVVLPEVVLADAHPLAAQAPERLDDRAGEAGAAVGVVDDDAIPDAAVVAVGIRVALLRAHRTAQHVVRAQAADTTGTGGVRDALELAHGLVRVAVVVVSGGTVDARRLFLVTVDTQQLIAARRREGDELAAGGLDLTVVARCSDVSSRTPRHDQHGRCDAEGSSGEGTPSRKNLLLH